MQLVEDYGWPTSHPSSRKVATFDPDVHESAEEQLSWTRRQEHEVGNIFRMCGLLHTSLSMLTDGFLFRHVDSKISRSESAVVDE